MHSAPKSIYQQIQVVPNVHKKISLVTGAPMSSFPVKGGRERRSSLWTFVKEIEYNQVAITTEHVAIKQSLTDHSKAVQPAAENDANNQKTKESQDCLPWNAQTKKQVA